MFDVALRKKRENASVTQTLPDLASFNPSYPHSVTDQSSWASPWTFGLNEGSIFDSSDE